MLNCDLTPTGQPGEYVCRRCGRVVQSKNSKIPPLRNCRKNQSPPQADIDAAAARLEWVGPICATLRRMLARWAAAGFPQRDPASVDRLWRSPCESRSVGGLCRAVGCGKNPDAHAACLHICRMATESCPRGKFTAGIPASPRSSPRSALPSAPINVHDRRRHGLERVRAKRGKLFRPPTRDERAADKRWLAAHPEARPAAIPQTPVVTGLVPPIPGKIDVVYPLGTGSRWNDNELRYSLRSLEKNFPDLGRVWIVGHRPAWLSGVVHIAMDDVHRHNKDANLIDKVLAACRAGVTERFVFCSDDQVFLQPIRFNKMKPLHYDDITAKRNWPDGHSWWQRLRATRDALISREIAAVKNYDSHCPTPIDRDKFLAVVPTFDYAPPPGYTINTLYYNAAGVAGEPVRKHKYTAEAGCDDPEQIRAGMKGRLYCGYNDAALTPAFKEVVEKMFPERSRFERMRDCPVCAFDDPILEPELSPVPKDWADRLDVKERHIAAFRELLKRRFEPPKNLSGDGIVICGEGRFWPGIVVAVKLLRDMGCNLPVQVWHNGPIGGELDGDRAVSRIDAREFSKQHPARILRGWEIKTYAILHSGFARVLYLDADAYCVADPSPLFSRLDGTPFAFWNDLRRQRDRVKWDWYGINPAISHSVQGGQLVIDLQRFWRETNIAHWLNQHSDYYYSHQYGDQDSWKIALTTTNTNPVCIGQAVRPNNASLLVLYCNAAPVIVHRTNEKLWFDKHGIPPRYVNGLPLEERIHEIYDELFGGMRGVFHQIYRTAAWGHKGLGSGSGSEESAIQPYLDFITSQSEVINAAKVVDLGCGSGIVTRRLPATEVVGVDVYSPHLERLRSECPDKEWYEIDVYADRAMLPCGDVALMKDVLQHWPSNMIVEWLNWARISGKWKWLFITQDNRQRKDDCPIGGYRGLDPNRPPLSKINGLDVVFNYGKKSIMRLVIHGRQS